MKGISNPEEIVRLRIPDLLADEISDKVDDLERETAAIISFRNQREVIEIAGCINGVTKAAMSIEYTINVFIEEQNPTGTELCQDAERTAGIAISTDGDNSNRDGVLFSNAIPAPYFCHGDELVDQSQCNYVPLNDFPSKQNYCFCNNNESSRKSGSCPGCNEELQKQGGCSFSPSTEPTLTTDLMEFGLKLGYREDEVKSAMKKLGTETAVNQNELLHELIKASTSAKQIGKTEECKVENATGYPRPVDSSILRHVVIDGSNVAMR